MGKRYEERGLLLRDGSHVVLQRDGGGTWRLDVPMGIRTGSRLGRRVELFSVRSGLDLLNVMQIELCD